MREGPFLFPKCKISSFLPFFSFPSSFPSFLPPSLPFFLFFSFPSPLLLSLLLSSSPCSRCHKNFPASTKVVLSPWWIHSSMLIIFWNLAYGGLWLKGLVLRKKISISFFQGRERFCGFPEGGRFVDLSSLLIRMVISVLLTLLIWHQFFSIHIKTPKGNFCEDGPKNNWCIFTFVKC